MDVSQYGRYIPPEKSDNKKLTDGLIVLTSRSIMPVSRGAESASGLAGVVRFTYSSRWTCNIDELFFLALFLIESLSQKL